MMKAVFNSCIVTASAVLALSAGAARADLTAEQVWEDWRSHFARSGYTFDATETRIGNTLEVTDIEMSLEPSQRGRMTMALPPLALTENGDGTVSLNLPDSFPVTVEAQAPGEEVTKFSTAVELKDADILASGDVSEIVYDYSISEITVSLDFISVDGSETDISSLGVARFSLADFRGNSLTKEGDDIEYTQSISMGATHLDIDFDDPEGGSNVILNYGWDNALVETVAQFPADADLDVSAPFYQWGAHTDIDMAVTGLTFDLSGSGDGTTFQMTSAAETGTLSFFLNPDAVSYDTRARNLDVTVVGSDIPFPIAFSSGEASFKVEAPYQAREEAQDFAFGFTLGDFVMSDLLWGIFDPNAQIPRDPATISVDLEGTAKLDVDIFDEDQLEQWAGEEEFPGYLMSLNLKDLVFSAAGAALTGQGAFTFDNEDLTTFEGFPAPVGALDLKLNGADGLLNTLTQMGLLPEQQASLARLAMGLFAVPGSEPDSLVSRIEVRPDGQVLANGQRIR